MCERWWRKSRGWRKRKRSSRVGVVMVVVEEEYME